MSKQMYKTRSLKFNVLMNMILTSSGFIFPLVTIPYVSRILLPSEMGAVSFAQSLVTFFSLVAVLGIPVYGIRACASVRDDEAKLATVVKELMIILTVSTTCVFIIFLLSTQLVPAMHNEYALFMMFGCVIWLSSFGVEWFYQALEQYGYITVRSILFKLFALVLMFIMVRHSGDYLFYGITVLVSGYASNILNIIRLRRLVNWSASEKMHVMRHFKPMLWFAIASTASNMYVQADVVMLGFLGTQHMVGLYQLVFKIKAVLISATNSVGNAVLPRLAFYSAHNKADESLKLMAKNFNFIAIFASWIIAVCVLCATPIVLIAGGSNYGDSAIALQLVAPAVLLSPINYALGTNMIAHNLEHRWALLNVVGLVIVLSANMILVPLVGIAGSAISITLCEGIMVIFRIIASYEFLRGIGHYLQVIKISVAALTTTALAYCIIAYLPSSHYQIVVLCINTVIFSILYFCSLLLLRVSVVADIVSTILHKRRK